MALSRRSQKNSAMQCMGLVLHKTHPIVAPPLSRRPLLENGACLAARHRLVTAHGRRAARQRQDHGAAWLRLRRWETLLPLFGRHLC